jgi:hypothetical protein
LIWIGLLIYLFIFFPISVTFIFLQFLKGWNIETFNKHFYLKNSYRTAISYRFYETMLWRQEKYCCVIYIYVFKKKISKTSGHTNITRSYGLQNFELGNMYTMCFLKRVCQNWSNSLYSDEMACIYFHILLSFCQNSMS